MTLLELVFIWIIPIACLIAAITFAVGEVKNDEETIKQLKEELKQCHKQHSV